MQVREAPRRREMEWSKQGAMGGGYKIARPCEMGTQLEYVGIRSQANT